jgi:[acyl-carrier-protein] S-malonyltransferase
VGIADWILDNAPRGRRVFERGREVLGFDVEKICREGPEEELNATRVAQPAIFLHSMALLEHLSERNGRGGQFGLDLEAGAAAGHSLGEYSALVFVGSLEFEEALEIVGARGRYMQDSCDQEPGGMVAVLNLDVEKVKEAVDRGGKLGPIGIANYNSQKQIVISGASAALEEAVRVARELGCRRAVPLPVAGAYHSPLMAGAAERLEPHLRKATIRSPRIPFYPNVSAREVRDPEEIRECLIRQVESSVRWEETIRSLAGRGLERGLEVGPGKILTGLAKTINCGLTVESAEEESTRKAVL